MLGEFFIPLRARIGGGDQPLCVRPSRLLKFHQRCRHVFLWRFNAAANASASSIAMRVPEPIEK